MPEAQESADSSSLKIRLDWLNMLENMSLKVKAHAPPQDATQLAANQSEAGESSGRLNCNL